MHTFEFIRPTDSAAAIAAAAQSKTAQQGADVRFMGGGTTLIDLMKLNVETPARVLDINRLPFDKIELMPDGGLKIGATVRNSDLAYDPHVQRDYFVLSQAILNGASAQIRNLATVAGNLLQRTRCMYFRDTAMPCNKREPGSGCPAIAGSNRTLAILGTSEHCIATNPSDMCVAMAALEANIHVQGPKGPRAIAFGDFHLLPGSTPDRETVLEPGDLITHVTLPPPIAGSKQVYLDHLGQWWTAKYGKVGHNFFADAEHHPVRFRNGVPLPADLWAHWWARPQTTRLYAKLQKPRYEVPSLRVKTVSRSN